MTSMTVNTAMGYAYDFASMSNCHDKHVGCVLLSEDYWFLSAGFNLSCGERKCLKEQDKKCPATHAEIAALESLGHKSFTPCVALKGLNTAFYTPYIAVCTLEPCFDCAQALYAAGVRKIYFHKKTSAQKSGIDWFKMQEDCNASQVKYENKLRGQKFISFSSVMASLFMDMLTGFARGTTSSLEDHSEDKPVAWESLFTDIRQYHRDGTHIAEYRCTPLITGLQKQQLRDMVLALTDEAHEALHEVDWKPWKKYGGSPKVNIEKFLEETGDILFFIDGMLMTFGLSWDDLASAVEKKLKVARDRMANGYHD